MLHDIGKQIREKRRASRLSLSQTAQIAKTEPQTLISLEWNLVDDVDAYTFNKIIQALDLDTEKLFGSLNRHSRSFDEELSNFEQLMLRCDEVRSRAQLMYFRAIKMRREAKSMRARLRSRLPRSANRVTG